MAEKFFGKLQSDFHIDYYKGVGFKSDYRVLHSHDYHEFSLISSGDITYTSNKFVDRVNEKAIIFSRAYELHNPFINQDEQYERHQICFRPNFLPSFLPEHLTQFSPVMSHCGIYRISDATYEQMLPIMKALLSRYKKDNSSASAMLEYKLLTSELMLLAAEEALKSPRREDYLSDTYIGKIVQYIQHHYSEDITLEYLSAKFFVSRTKLVNDFKEHVGMTVGRFLTLTRIEAAKVLLRQGYSVHNVANLCGYSGVSYFIKIFCEYTLMTPLKFQQRASDDA